MKAVLILSFLCTRAFGTESVSFDDLQHFVEQEKIRSVDKFVEVLPEKYMRGVAFGFASRSLQKATKERPRMLISSFRGTSTQPEEYVVMGVSGVTTDPFADSIEVMEFNKSTPGFRFHRISFQENSDPIFEKNPAVCKRCHGKMPQPIWDNYGAWPGFLGSLTTNTNKPKESWEMDLIEKLKKDLAEHPRYKRFVPRIAYKESLNNSLSQQFHNQMARTFVARLRTHTHYAGLREYILYSKLSLLPTTAVERLNTILAQVKSETCASLKRTAKSIVSRLIKTSDGKLERRVLDFWNLSYGTQHRERRLEAVRRLVKSEVAIPVLTTTKPREFVAQADGNFGLIERIVRILCKEVNCGLSYPSESIVYNPRNHFRFNLETKTGQFESATTCKGLKIELP